MIRNCLLCIGEWTAPLGKDPKRPDPIGGFAFTKIDQERALMFGGSGSNGRVNTAQFFNLEQRVNRSYNPMHV